VRRSRLIVMIALAALGCGDAALCENSAQVEISSPDQQLVAWIFIRGCGAAVGDSIQVSILPAGSAPPEDAGNTFIMDKRGEVRVDWTADRELLISHEPAKPISRQETDVAGVKVSYEVE
jgi:hypothetical protein